MDPLTTLRSAMNFDPAGAVPSALGRTEGLKNPATIIPAGELKDLGTPSVGAANGPSGGTFGNLLSNLVKDVTAKQAESSNLSRALLSGQNVPLHKVMIASEEASLSFQLMVEVRNKLLESYQELMRMQV